MSVAPALAAPVLVGLASRDGAIGPAEQAAFRTGAQTTPAKANPALLDAALTALERGEAAFLELKLRPAERSLKAAFDGLIGAIASLDDAVPAVRAGLLLVQVQLARGRRAQAEATVERALLALPGFPAGGQPPPDVQPIIDSARARLKSRLTASLTVSTTPPGAYVRLNGVPVGQSPVTVGALGPGPVRLTIQAGRRVISRALVLKSGRAEARIYAGESTPAHAQLLAALAAGKPADVYLAASALQSMTGADTACAGLIVPQRGVYILRLDGPRRRVAGAYRVPRPSRAEDWRALGRFCSARAPTNARPAEVNAIMRMGAPARPAPPTGKKSGVGWGLLAGSGAALAASIYFGLDANDSADQYNARGRSDDKSAAVRSAAIADTGYVISASLLAAAIYLLTD